MAKKNYYAVKSGREPGIYRTWDKCKEQIDGFSGGEYKGFVTLEEAESYMNDFPLVSLSVGDSDAVYYIDGSFNPKYNVYGYGVFCQPTNGESYTFSGAGNSPECVPFRNDAAEMIGSMKCIVDGIKQGYKTITVCYDYLGVENYVTGKWRAEKTLSSKYKKFMLDKLKMIDVNFCKVVAHSGVEHNEEVDRLAKDAVIAFVEEHNLG